MEDNLRKGIPYEHYVMKHIPTGKLNIFYNIYQEDSQGYSIGDGMTSGRDKEYEVLYSSPDIQKAKNFKKGYENKQK